MGSLSLLVVIIVVVVAMVGGVVVIQRGCRSCRGLRVNWGGLEIEIWIFRVFLAYIHGSYCWDFGRKWRGYCAAHNMGTD